MEAFILQNISFGICVLTCLTVVYIILKIRKCYSEWPFIWLFTIDVFPMGKGLTDEVNFAPFSLGRYLHMERNTDNILRGWYGNKKGIYGEYRVGILPALVLCAWMAISALAEKLPQASVTPTVPDIPGEAPEGLDKMPESGMFEWDESSILRIEEALDLVSRLGITHWYQEIEFSDLDSQELSAFIEAMTETNVEVYALAGAKEWGYESDGASLIAYMENVRRYNEEVASEQRIKGIMADVEPYILKDWEENKQANMETYVSGMVKAHEWAEDNSLLLIVCIPRHYDDQGLVEQLETLISMGCDEVAVMDYECGMEVERIETEALLAIRYGKPLHCILEFQEVGKHGLTENKTYYNKGIEAAREVWRQVDAAFGEAELIRDYHWTEPIWDMLEREEGEHSE